jgi:hypothetical protein
MAKAKADAALEKAVIGVAITLAPVPRREPDDVEVRLAWQSRRSRKLRTVLLPNAPTARKCLWGRFSGDKIVVCAL